MNHFKTGMSGKYGQYDRFGVPLWNTGLLTPEDETKRDDDINQYSNIVSTYLKQSQLAKDIDPKNVLNTLLAVKELSKEEEDKEDDPISDFKTAVMLQQRLEKENRTKQLRYADGYYINAKDGTISYYDTEKEDFVKSRQIKVATGEETLVFPVEHKTVNHYLNIYSVMLPEPRISQNSIPKGYEAVHELIGFTDNTQLGVGIDEQVADCIAFGSGSIPVCITDKYEEWRVKSQEEFQKTGDIPNFNDTVYLMSDNKQKVLFNPYKPGTCIPLQPCKGVWSEVNVFKKPQYAKEIRNQGVVSNFNSNGKTYNLRDQHTGNGIICHGNIINILGGHCDVSSESDHINKAKLRKLQLYLRPVFIEKEQPKDWRDVWDAVIQDNLQTDMIYDGEMNFGPNFNRRPESVHVLEKPEIPMVLPTTHLHSLATSAHKDMIDEVHEQHPLGGDSTMDTHTLDPDTSTQQSQTPTPHHTLPPLQDESIGTWAERNLMIRPDDVTYTDNLMAPIMSALGDFDPSKLKGNIVIESFKAYVESLISQRNLNEKMFTSISATNNTACDKIPGMGNQLTYDARFKPFVNSNLGTTSVLMNYTQFGLIDQQALHAIDKDQLKTVSEGLRDTQTGKYREIQVFYRYGDLLRFMFGYVDNGPMFKSIIDTLSMTVEYVCQKLAEKEIHYPNTSELLEKWGPTNWYRYSDGAPETPEYLNIEFCGFDNPDKETLSRAYESYLTWASLTALILVYAKHDAADMDGHNATDKCHEWTNSLLVKSVENSDYTLSAAAAYFDLYHDSPLFCQYGGISGNEYRYGRNKKETDKFQPSIESFSYIGEFFDGGVVMQYARELDADFIDPGQMGSIVTFDRSVYKYWNYLTETWKDSAGSRTTFGRELQKLNEIFRGGNLYNEFLRSVGKDTIRDSQGRNYNTAKVWDIPTSEKITEIIGVKEEGRDKFFTLQRLVATHDFKHDAEYQKNADESGLVWKLYYHLFGTQAYWSGQCTYFNYVAENFPPWEAREGEQSYNYEAAADEARDLFLNKYRFEDKPDEEVKYNLHTRNIATGTINKAQYILTGGNFTVQGADMKFINRIIPLEDKTWYDTQHGSFRKIFKLAQSEHEYYSVFRPFGDYIWVNNRHISLKPYIRRPYFRLGNRAKQVTPAELQD